MNAPLLTPPSPAPIDDLAEAFARQLGLWAQRRGLAEGRLRGVQALGRRLMRAIGEGHVCLALEAGSSDAALATELMALGLADDGDHTPDRLATPPLVRDRDGRLYLRRHFDQECRLAASLAARAQALAVAASAGHPAGSGGDATGAHAALPAPHETLPDPATIAARLAAFFPPADGAPDWQRLAVAQALVRRLTVISGGPGTGKTTTVARLLACLLTAQPDLRIALAAPTGKAAARMEESLRKQAGSFPPELQALLPSRAATIHRLLGVRGDGGFAHDREHPLALDVLVVDEASMLDLALAARLVDAVPPAARLILLGDRDQLAAVEAGAVFAELCAEPGFSPAFADWLAAAGEAPAANFPQSQGPLADSVICLSRSHRFSADSGIGRLAAEIRAGQGGEALAWLGAEAVPDDPLADGDGVAWLEDTGSTPSAALQARLLAGYAPYLAALQADCQDPAPLFAAFERFRVLCARREGGRGVAAINGLVEAHLRARFPHPANPGPLHPWYVGRAILVQRNDYALGLFNGDIGLCLPHPQGGLQVVFPAGSGEGYRAVATLRLPEHSSAFALTVHKSQGSEFEAIALLLPEQDSPLLTRELLYTGLTRARRRALLSGPAERFADACARPTQRSSGLRARLGQR